MNVNVAAWHHCYDNFENQVNVFNQRVQASALTEENVGEIYEVVKREVDRLSELTQAAKAREEELSQGGWCYASISKKIRHLGLLSGACKACEIAGAILAITAEENLETKWIGVGLFVIGELFDSAATLYETKICLQSDETSQLARLNKEGLEHAQIFEKFLKQLKDLKHMETQLLEEYELYKKQPLTADHVIINLESSKSLDDRISDCLKEYEELPTRYRRDEIYCRIISHLIQKLPPNDPLRIGLAELEPISNQDISALAEQPLPVRYFPTMTKRKSSLDHQSSANPWIAEEQSKLIADEVNKKSEREDLLLEYQQKVAYYKHQVNQRFHLKHDIPFFETPHGWQIHSREGVKKID